MNLIIYLGVFALSGCIFFFVTRSFFSRKNMDLQLRNKELETESAMLREKVLEAKENLEQAKKEATDRLEKETKATKERFDEQVVRLQELFKNSATDILKARSKDLSQTNSEQIKNILSPLSVKMEEFKKAVEDQGSTSIKNTTSIEKHITAMMEQTNAISKEAGNLAKALKSNNKVQGNWGEVVLKNILESMGLTMGKDFVLQETLKDADGNSIKNEDSNRKMIPDAVLFLPDRKAIAIDSKVSLSAYIDYCNAESDIERDSALKRHCDSVRTHIKELSAKQYGKYLKQTGVDGLEYVVMFVPNEGAYQLFYAQDSAEWYKSFENKILIAGESNLFAMLKIIDVAWIQIQQQKNVDEVMRVAGELLDRVAKFANVFEDIGKTFEKSMSQYESARKKLVGRRSVRVSWEKLETMGVVSSKEVLRESLRSDNEIEQLNTRNDE